MPADLLATKFDYEVSNVEYDELSATIERSYYWHPMLGNAIILQNGATLQPHIDEKTFLAHVPKLDDVTGRHTRMFYRSLENLALDCGIYLAPYALIHPNNRKGFIVGTDGNIPSTCQSKIEQWSHKIATALHKDRVIPREHPNYTLICASDDGYKMLSLIVGPTHPNFPTCGILTDNLPKQTMGHSLFRNLFWSFMMRLRSWLFLKIMHFALDSRKQLHTSSRTVIPSSADTYLGDTTKTKVWQRMRTSLTPTYSVPLLKRIYRKMTSSIIRPVRPLSSSSAPVT
jgi:hypothetical protein